MFSFLKNIRTFFKTKSELEPQVKNEVLPIDFSEFDVKFEFRELKGNTLFEIERLSGLTIIILNIKSSFIEQLKDASQETKNTVFTLIYSMANIEQKSSDYEQEVLERFRLRVGKTLSSLPMYSKEK
ncbi:hypothetical protein [Parashewanella tropica]|uniref:hypothetical protein n=1 Tax=Parashewanella tropica TaxID=2547970 RepID=UPI0010597AC2|nr:hypothetical protein [Parashewanella tropica]